MNLIRLYQLQYMMVGPSQYWVIFSPNNKNMTVLSRVFNSGELLRYCIIITSLQLHPELNISKIFEVVDMLIYCQIAPHWRTDSLLQSCLRKSLHWFLKGGAMRKWNLEKNAFGSYVDYKWCTFNLKRPISIYWKPPEFHGSSKSVKISIYSW